MNKSDPTSVQNLLELIRKGISEAFRYAIPGIMCLVLLKLARPNLFTSLAQILNVHVTVWAVAAIASGMIAYSLHRSILFLLDVAFLFATRFTAVEEFRKGRPRSDRLGPWIDFLVYKYARESKHAKLLDYFGFRWSMGHAIATLGEVGTFFVLVSRVDSPLRMHFAFALIIFLAVLAIGLLTLATLYWTERRLYQRIK